MAWIKQQTRWQEHTQALPKQFDPDLTVPHLHFDAQALHQELRTLMARYGPVCWRSQAPGALWGLSLSYNPQAPVDEWHRGSFGHPRYRSLAASAYFTAPEQERDTAPRGDYLDSLGFRRLLPEIDHLPALRELFARFAMPVVRCSVRVIDGERVWPTVDSTGGMHCDDSPFEVLRLNLCITGSADLGLQYAGCAPMVLPAGAHRVINTDVPHRVWAAKRSPGLRMHLVVGLTPWLNHDPACDVWSLNAHFATTHPYDLVRRHGVWRSR